MESKVTMDPHLEAHGRAVGRSDKVTRVCTRCIMDTTAPDIRFDAKGKCNYCTEYTQLLTRRSSQADRAHLNEVLREIHKAGSGQPYDCIIGVSGGLDSSYVLYQAKALGLRPLAVHMDNGWNSELSVANIERLVRQLDVELYTDVIDWESFRDLQRSFFDADVVDIELLTDNIIAGSLQRVAKLVETRFILYGTNTTNEGMRMPPGWNHAKSDLRNIKAIYRRFGSGRPLKSLPLTGLVAKYVTRYLRRVRTIPLLEYVHYDTREAQDTLINELQWRPYEKKHYESVFTRFYQGYILPHKFNVDKRKVHYSTLICAGELSREEALARMQDEPYSDPALLAHDREFVLKKLKMSEEKFEAYMQRPPVPHTTYPSAVGRMKRLNVIRRLLRPGIG